MGVRSKKWKAEVTNFKMSNDKVLSDKVQNLVKKNINTVEAAECQTESDNIYRWFSPSNLE